MANDRLVIICVNCREGILFAKYYPTLGHGIWFSEKVNTFVEEHMKCSPNFGKNDLGGDKCFEIKADSAIKGEMVSKIDGAIIYK